ncbi:hypothetical protein Tco_1407704 [Tanacetum coccineum]
MSTPATTEEKTNKKNDVKARGLLLMALPNEHQLTFSQHPNAKSMFAAIETIFGGNVATKKTQKTLLKQRYENFSATSAESLDSIFNRLQKIVSRLAILGMIIAQEDLNLKFLSSLPPEWNTHVVVWMNKPEVETMSIDDFAASLSVNAASLQVCTVSVSDNTVYDFMVENPNGSNVLHQDLEQIHKDDLEAIDLKWQLSLLSVRANKYYQRTGEKIFINANDIAGYDKSKVAWWGFPGGRLPGGGLPGGRSVHEAKRHYYTGRHNAVNTARSYTGQVNAVRGKPQHDDKGFIDSGCSRYIIGNIAYLSDFKLFDGGYFESLEGWIGSMVYGLVVGRRLQGKIVRILDLMIQMSNRMKQKDQSRHYETLQAGREI